MESYFEKIVRHVRDGEFDIETLRSGIWQGFNNLNRLQNETPQPKDINVEVDFYDVPGLISTEYIFDNMYFPSRDLRLRVFDFPEDLEFRVVDTGDGQTYATTEANLLDPSTVAALTGPTFIGQLPNNGFYHEGTGGLHVQFGEVPQGETRGAVARKKDGSLAIYSDEQVAASIASGFEDVTSLSAASKVLYPQRANQLDERTKRSPVSHIGLSEGDSGHVVFTAAKFPVTRDFMTLLLAYHGKSMGHTVDARFVELELMHSHAVIYGPTKCGMFGGGGFINRRDHYLLCRPDQELNA